MHRKSRKIRGKIVLRSIPTPQVEEKVVDFLARLFKKTPVDRIRARIRRPPLVLAKNVSAEKGRLIAGRLEKIGAKASFIPLRPAELQKAAEPEAKPRIVDRTVEIVPPPFHGRKKKIRIAAAGLLLLASLCFLTFRIHEAMIRPVPAELVFRPIDYAPPSVTAADAEDIGSAFDLRYRLRPDSRLVRAFGIAAERFATFKGLSSSPEFSLGPVSTNARQLSLPLISGGKKIDELVLPLPLGFADAMDGLDRWYAMMNRHVDTGASPGQGSRASRRPPATAEPDGGPIDLLESLLATQTAWARTGPDRILLRKASREYAILATVLYPDPLNLTDELISFALSLSAACRQGDDRVSQYLERALLARAMGYGPYREKGSGSGDGQTFQGRLLAAFLAEDTAAVESMEKKGGLLATYLLMRIYRERAQNGLADDAARRLLSRDPYFFPAMAATIFDGDLSDAKRLSIVYPVFLLLKLKAGSFPGGGIVGDWTGAVQWFSDGGSKTDLSISGFESTLQEKKSAAPNLSSGALFDAARAASVWRCLYLNALFLRYRLLGKRWEKPHLAQAFAELLASKNPRHPLVMFMRARSAQEFGISERALSGLKSLLAVPEASPAMLRGVYKKIASDQARMRYWPEVFDRLDGRPRNLAFSGAAFYRLLSLDLAEKFTTAALRLNGRFYGDYGLLARIAGDDSELQNALKRFPGQPALLLSAAGYYSAKKGGGARAEALRLYRHLQTILPENVHVFEQLVKALRDAGRQPEAMLLVESFLKTHDQGPGSEIRLLQARTYLDLDEPRKALHAVSGALDSYDPRALLVAALANENMGNLSKARQYIRLAASRAGGDEKILLPVAAYFWRHGNDRLAAGFIARLRKKRTGTLVYVKEFVSSLAGANLKRLRDAIEELVDTGAVFEEIHRIAVHYAKANKTAIAMDLLSRAPAPDAVSKMEKVASRYEILDISQGRLKAVQYLADSIPPEKGNLLARILYERGLFEPILAEFVLPEFHPVGLRERVWIYRLTAWLATKKTSRSIGTVMDRHYRDPYEPEPDHPLQRTEALYHAVGRYLMGKISARELLAASGQVDDRCIFAYFIGLSNRFDENYAEATKWYHICRQSDASGLLEYRWATRELADWQSAGMRNRSRLWHRPFGLPAP